MTHRSQPELLALHGVRVLGSPSAAEVADLYRLDSQAISEHLLDAQASGWVRRDDFGGRTSWSMTDRGRAENERQLAQELEQVGARQLVTAAHAAFLPLNRRLSNACTTWQIRPTSSDPMAANDHSDWGWDEDVLRTLASIGSDLTRLTSGLVALLSRFEGHAPRYLSALHRVERGDRTWVDAPGRPSCHIVWIQIHEDLLATLGIPRGSDS